ncbi:choice-of-anchor L domain-containing protein [uncultured Winogradskyella sp.]|uniref:choice-of-anchor L domain-containing protein n=1 Tax=uncultured Winogradskyella sp. TaxID=395353 RepID=UPI0030DBB6D2|tara:strand:- start:117689 stop:123352 length:5664 start_codon:yes stop_codon:yes gene_type:complete
MFNTKQSLGLFLCFIFSFSFAQQITINNNVSSESLIEDTLIQGCVEVSNISSPINGNSIGLGSFGYFERGTSSFPFENGIVLTTGNANSGGNSANNTTLNDGDATWTTDSDLESALGISNTLNATAIEFDFVSISNQIQFNYILASEEYFGNFPCQYSDGFAFLIREAGSGAPYVNIALVPGTSTPVNTNTVHDEIVGFCDAANGQFFEGYNLGDTNYNGRTTVLSATATIQPNVQYQIKLVIADQTDENYDSAVFIEGNSFNATVDLGEDVTTCATNVVLDGDIENPLATYSWYLDGVLISGANQPIFNTIETGNYRIEITIPLSGSACIIEDETNITLSSTQSAGPILDFEICDDLSADDIEFFNLNTKDTEVLASVPISNYTISYHLSNTDALDGTNPITTSIENTSNPQLIHVRIEDVNNGCLAYSTFNLVVNPLPTIIAPTPLDVCDDQTADGFTAIDLNIKNDEITNGQTNLVVTYHSNASDATTGSNAIPMPFVNTSINEQVFVSVQNPQTGCISTTTLDISVLDNPVINMDDHYIDACDIDHDGFAEFDLTTIIPDVLQGLSDVTVTFHETNEDALSGANPIADDTNYTNIVNSEQLVYIRVENNSTGCASVTPIEIHTNLLLTATNINNVTRCDVDNDNNEEFNLENIAIGIINDLDTVTVEFYLTEEDRDNQINAIDQSITFIPTANPQTVFIGLASDTCTDVDDIDFILVPVQEFDPISMQTVCDENQDGLTTTDLSDFNTSVTEGLPGFIVTYFLTEDDALSGANALPNFYTNTTNPYTVFPRIQAVGTGCFDVNSFDITVLEAPTTTAPNQIIICDNDQDGFSIVNLTSVISQVVTDTNERSITFHNSLSNANNNLNTITNTTAYNAQTESVFIRVTNTVTSCHSVEELPIIVNTLPVFQPIENYKICEDNSDGFGDFLFNTKDIEILNGQPGKQVIYYVNQNDADNRVNAINKNAIYQNVSNPQTIYVRVENLTDQDCYGTSSFTIEVGTNPIFNAPANWFVCDDVSNDGSETFNLSTKVTEIAQGIADNLAITFYTSQFNAENSINPLPNDFTNTVNPQQIYVQIDNGTICNSITTFELNVIQVPEVNQSEPLELCDTDADGFVEFNLTDAEIDILDVRQDDIIITYFESLEDLETNTDAIPNPEAYTNISNPQTVFIKITNTISNCYAAVPIDLFVNLPPAINDFEEFEICDNTTSSFNLSQINSIIVDDATNINISYFTTYLDAFDNTNNLDNSYTYLTNLDTIYVRITSTTTTCFTVYDFNLIVNPLPIANQPNDLETCDDASNDGFESFNLDQQTATILGVQNATNFTVTYHLNLANANSNTNAIGPNYTANVSQSIHARVENNTTGCYSLTSYNLLVNAHPNAPQPLLECDTDYDASTGFNLTQAETDLFETVNPNNTISYFESSTDLQANINAITNTSNYQNISNPQTVYIRVDNTVADCFTFVPLTLSVNLPPAINQFETYDICANASNSFDLTEINEALMDETFNVLFSYYTNESDAIALTNALDSNYTYASNTDVLFVRVEFSTTHCFFIYQFNLNVNPTPTIHQSNDLIGCDDNFDGILEFNLTTQNASLLGNQSAAQYAVTYHNSQLDANQNSNALNTDYFAFNTEVIYARIENNTTGCYNTTQFTAIINPIPSIDIEDQVICLDNLPLLVSANTNDPTDQYLWSTGETSPEIEITAIGIYWVTVTNVFGCENTRTFGVSESEAATIEVTETIDFSDPNNIIITVSGIGDYLYQLDDGIPQESPVFENVALGYHTITIIDVNGCSEVTQEVVVIDAPKHMTPNADGDFDTWHISGVETLPGTIIYIFDRYGKLLTQLGANTPGWDGTYNGNKMPASDYWFLAKVKQGDASFEVKGHFALRR